MTQLTLAADRHAQSDHRYKAGLKLKDKKMRLRKILNACHGKTMCEGGGDDEAMEGEAAAGRGGCGAMQPKIMYDCLTYSVEHRRRKDEDAPEAAPKKEVRERMVSAVHQESIALFSVAICTAILARAWEMMWSQGSRVGRFWGQKSQVASIAPRNRSISSPLPLPSCGAQELTAEQVYAIFKRISDEDCVAMGLTPALTRPDWLLITALPVPPLAVRPSVQMSSAARSEDDLTHVLSDIIRANNNLRRQQEAGAPPHVIAEFTSLLQVRGGGARGD